MKVLCITMCGDAHISLRAFSIMKTRQHIFTIATGIRLLVSSWNVTTCYPSSVHTRPRMQGVSVYTELLSAVNHLRNLLPDTGCIARPRRPVSLLL